MPESVKFHFSSPEKSPGFLLWQVNMLWQRRLKRVLDTLDLTHTQFVLLAALGWLEKNQSTITQADIATQSKTDRMMTSKVLRSLQAKAYLTRREHETDTRAKSIALTASGRTILQEALQLVEQTDVEFFSVLSEAEAGFLTSLLRLMTENEKFDHGH